MGFAFALTTVIWASLPGAAGTSTSDVQQDEAAQQAFRAGVDAARQEHWSEARASFEKAYGLSPRPVVLINLAGAQARTGQLTEAAKNYRRILEDESLPETASFRRAAADVLPALEARIPHIRLRPSGLSATDVIQIDGTTIAEEKVGSGHPLDPGEHTLVVRNGGTERARVLFTLVERELRYISLPLPELVQRPVVPPIVGVGTDDDGDPITVVEKRPARHWWRSPWIWTGVALVVVGAAVTTFVLVNHREDPFMGNIPPGVISVR